MRKELRLIILLVPLLVLSSNCRSALSGESPSQQVFATLANADDPLPDDLRDTLLMGDGSRFRANILHFYAVNTPLWSDGLNKSRYVFVPPEATIQWNSANNAFDYPVGTAFIKHFANADDHQEPIETRLFVKKSDQRWYGAVYIWQGGVAKRITGGQTINNAATGNQNYHIPSQKECDSCHTDQSHAILGFIPEQLLSDSNTASSVLNQLNAQKILTANQQSLSGKHIPYSNLEKGQASVEEKARAYLQVNCSSCHNPEGIAPFMDLRYETPFAQTGLSEVERVVPGDHTASEIWQRMSATEKTKRMPPISYQPDLKAVEMIAAWIDGMPH